MHDVIVVGGGFAGVTAAREAALKGSSVLLLEARDRLGGRTWTAPWNGGTIEYGGAWVHWHQPHTFSELTRAGLEVALDEAGERAGWYVGDSRHAATLQERDAIARRGWDLFVDGVEEALPLPHDPLFAIDKLRRFDQLSIAERLAQLELDAEEREVLTAELESLAHAPLEDAGAVAVLRWHALSGYSLALTQFTGGRVTIAKGTGALLDAIASAAPFNRRVETTVGAVSREGGKVQVCATTGEVFPGRTAIVALPLNALGAVEFSPPLSDAKRDAISLGQASRGIKIFIRARGEPVLTNSIRPAHPFGYLASDVVFDDGSQQLIGFGPDARACRVRDLGWVQSSLDELLPGYQVLDATAYDWVADPFSAGTWAIHRPGWYEHCHGAMQEAEGSVLFAGSDIANGWAGFIDGAIETGLRAGARASALSQK